jgi:hypothetical protein
MTSLALALLLAAQADPGAITLPALWGSFVAVPGCEPVDLPIGIDAIMGQVKCPGVGLDMLVFAAPGTASAPLACRPPKDDTLPEQAAGPPIPFVTASGAAVLICPGRAGSNKVTVFVSAALGRIEFHASPRRPEQLLTLMAIVSSYRPAPEGGKAESP